MYDRLFTAIMDKDKHLSALMLADDDKIAKQREKQSIKELIHSIQKMVIRNQKLAKKKETVQIKRKPKVVDQQLHPFSVLKQKFTQNEQLRSLRQQTRWHAEQERKETNKQVKQYTRIKSNLPVPHRRNEDPNQRYRTSVYSPGSLLQQNSEQLGQIYRKFDDLQAKLRSKSQRAEQSVSATS